jgi:hypothetical protein
MRYVAISLCVFAAACGGSTPTTPTSSLSLIGGTSATPDARVGTAVRQAEGGSQLPFKGTYEGEEKVVTSTEHQLIDATGNATHLGRFTVTAAWTIGPMGGIGTSTWTAANGDELHTSFTRSGIPAPPTITFTEIHTITGGSGRFANASGTFTVVQTRGLSMPYNNSATVDGTIDLGH